MDVLKELFGFERLQASGLLSKSSSPIDTRLTFYQGHLVFPILEDGSVASIQARKAGVVEGGSKYINLTGKRPRTYNVDILNSSTDQISICEGILDTMSAHQLGLAAIGLLGVSHSLQPNEIARLKGRRVALLLDWDDKGETKAEKLRAELSSQGIVCVRKSRPDPAVKDMNDFLRSRGDNVAT